MRVRREIQHALSVVTFDREHFAQEGFKAFVLASLGLDFFLQKFYIRLDLNVDQIGDRKRITTLREIAYFTHRDVLFFAGR